jgi:hypothetical protein
MSFQDFGKSLCQVQYISENSELNSLKYRLFNNAQFNANVTSPSDTLIGYLGLAAESKLSFKQFLKTNLPSSTNIKTYDSMFVVNRMVKVEPDDLFRKKFPNILISSDPVLIDSDYIQDEQEMLCQISISNVEGLNLDQNSEFLFPDLIFEARLYHADTDLGKEWPYFTPLFHSMRPTSEEDFLEDNLFNQFIVPDYVFIRATKGASGFDIFPRAIVDNAKDFTTETMADAVATRILIAPMYAVDIYFPKFYVSLTDQSYFSPQFILRSRVSKRNVSLEAAFKGHDVILRLTNNNRFPIYITEEPVKQDEIPFRFAQFVPSNHIAGVLALFGEDQKDDMAKFLGVVTIFNEKTRKPKI